MIESGGTAEGWRAYGWTIEVWTTVDGVVLHLYSDAVSPAECQRMLEVAQTQPEMLYKIAREVHRAFTENDSDSAGHRLWASLYGRRAPGARGL